MFRGRDFTGRVRVTLSLSRAHKLVILNYVKGPS